MQLYNSLGRRKEEFAPLRPGHVTMYACGITAYDYCHIGHARSAIVFDVLARHLRNMGLEVNFIRNFTDIDDKIINRANKENRDWREVGETYIRAFHEDMARLGVEPASLEPRATEHIQQIQTLCQKLVDKGLAYPADGDVYFRARKWAEYGKLSGRDLDEMQAGARIAPGEAKEDPLDFALWKGAKPGEPAWESPWGPGRPGWHIECSAMTGPHLPLDIHGGGLDLLFPHHENEIAQTEAATGEKLARFWVHNGFVRIDSEKMSKSLGNFKTIRDILKDWLPETLRFFLLGKHYRSPIDFSMESMSEAEKGQRRVYAALRDAKTALQRAKWKNTPLPAEIQEEWQSLPGQFAEAMDDDLNTAKAIGHIFSEARLVNRLLEDKNLRQSAGAREIFNEFLNHAQTWQAELGVFGNDPDTFFEDMRKIRIRRLGLDMARVEELLKKREEARAARNFALSDELRAELAGLGVSARDTPRGQEWDIE